MCSGGRRLVQRLDAVQHPLQAEVELVVDVLLATGSVEDPGTDRPGHRRVTLGVDQPGQHLAPRPRLSPSLLRELGGTDEVGPSAAWVLLYMASRRTELAFSASVNRVSSSAASPRSNHSSCLGPAGSPLIGTSRIHGCVR